MKKNYNNYYLEYIDREINILKSLNKYKNSVHYYGDYDSNNEKILILEKCDKNLRDLENILIKYINKEENKIILKLADYGISKIENNIYSGNRGTHDYVAPEILLEKVKEYKSSFDIFSLGIILYQISHKLKHPFKNYENELIEIRYLNFYEKDNYVIEFDKSIEDDNFKDLVSKMLKLKPENRLTWEEYFNHKFFKNN